MIYIGSDHGGYKQKEYLKKFLQKQKLAFIDVGAKKFKDGDDYPDYAKKVAKMVSKNPVTNQGILICRSGQGMCITANKFTGVRAALVWNKQAAIMSRNDDMSNILCLASEFTNNKAAENILMTWLATPYSTEKRHMRRIKKITNLDNFL